MHRFATLAVFIFASASTALAQGKKAPAPPAESQVPQITPDFAKPKTGHDPKHTPHIEAPAKVKAGEWFPVTITIGADAMHPSLMEHHVRYIALQFNGTEINRTYLHPVRSLPKVTYWVALEDSGTLVAVEEPTHTAQWTTEHKITVEKPAATPTAAPKK